MPCAPGRRGWLWVFLQETTCNAVQRSKLLRGVWQCRRNDERWWEPTLFVPGMWMKWLAHTIHSTDKPRYWNQQKRNKSTSTGAWAQAGPSLLRESKIRRNKESYELFHVQQVRAEIKSRQSIHLRSHSHPDTEANSTVRNTSTPKPTNPLANKQDAIPYSSHRSAYRTDLSWLFISLPGRLRYTSASWRGWFSLHFLFLNSFLFPVSLVLKSFFLSGRGKRRGFAYGLFVSLRLFARFSFFFTLLLLCPCQCNAK